LGRGKKKTRGRGGGRGPQPAVPDKQLQPDKSTKIITTTKYNHVHIAQAKTP